MRADPDGRARAVICPLCGAQPGKPCINVSPYSSFHGQVFATVVHRERVQEAGNG